VALTNDRFMKMFDELMSVVADFREFKADLDNKKMLVGSPKRKKTAPLKSVEVKTSVPNPNLAINIFTRRVMATMSASTGAGVLKLHCQQYPLAPKALVESLFLLVRLRNRTLRSFLCPQVK